MNVYQELQLNQIGSRNAVRSAVGFRQKLYHSLIYILKIFLTLAFCFAFVTAYSLFFGSDNSIVGVVVLLSIMVFRFADFGYHTPHALKALLIIFTLLMIGPKAANTLGPWGGFLINLISIFLLLFLGCHNVLLSNHSTLVLGYLLLYGYDVPDQDAFLSRICGLVFGCILTGIVYYRNHRKKAYKRTGHSLKKEFHLSSMRSRWQLTMTLGVSSILFLGRCLEMPRAMWGAIAVMSVLLPFKDDLKERIKGRIWGNVAGSLFFVVLYTLLPPSLYPYIGLIGGAGVGLSVTYRWQSLFNSLGAIAIAVGTLTLPGALFFRIFHNIFGSLYGLIIQWLADKSWSVLAKRDVPCKMP